MLITLKHTLNKKLKVRNEITRIHGYVKLHIPVSKYFITIQKILLRENHEIIKTDENIGKQLNCAEVAEMI